MAFLSLSDVRFEDIVLELNNYVDGTDEWCQRYGLIATEKNCDNCLNPMTLSSRYDITDGKIWRCSRPCNNRVSIRKGTFFENSRLPIATIVKFIYHSAYETLSINLARRELGMSQTTVVDWKMFLRDICVE